VPWGILIGGEELHNNHHAFVTSARFSTQWYEVDLGWIYIRLLERCGLAKVKRIAPKLRLTAPKTVCDVDTLQAIVTHRYQVMAKYARAVMRACAKETSPASADPTLRDFDEGTPAPPGRLLRRHARAPASNSITLCRVMGQELCALWESRMSSRDELLCHLQDWCRRAEASQILPLQRFSRELRRYG